MFYFFKVTMGHNTFRIGLNNIFNEITTYTFEINIGLFILNKLIYNGGKG